MTTTMPKLILPGTQIAVSRFIFGTASLFNVGNAKRRLALLEAAVDAGFTHFDTAPYYGFGWAERDLGALLRRHPGLTLTTKVGLYPPGGEAASRGAVLARKALGRLLPAISQPALDFSLARAQQALQGSLRRLGRERIEFYLLHEPELALLDTDEWRHWLEAEVQCGRIGAFGLALTVEERLLAFLQRAPHMAPVVQVLDSLDRCEADCLAAHGRSMQITYGYVSGERQRGSTRSVQEILSAALQRNRYGAIIVSTTQAARLGQYASLLRTSS